MCRQEVHGVGAEQQNARTKSADAYQTALRAAVASLYRDGILPQADMLRRRLEERGEQWSDWGHLRIRLTPASQTCAAAGLIVREAGPKAGISYSVLLPEGEEPFALLTEKEAERSNFETEWATLLSYLRSEVWFGPEHDLTSNYALARKLKQTPQSGVGRLRLGVVIGLIRQLLELRVLGHQRHSGGSRLVLFEDSWEQEQLTKYQTAEGVVRDWDELRRNLKHLLLLNRGSKGVLMSTLKTRHQRLFNQTLHEAAFNELKLERLLSDPRLADICEVRKEGTEAHVYPVLALQDFPARGRGSVAAVPLPSLMPMPSVVNTFLSYTRRDMEEDLEEVLTRPVRRSRSAGPARGCEQ